MPIVCLTFDVQRFKVIEIVLSSLEECVGSTSANQFIKNRQWDQQRSECRAKAILNHFVYVSSA